MNVTLRLGMSNARPEWKSVVHCLLVLATFFLVYPLQPAGAQWLGTNPVYFNAGNVGIGTQTPGSALSIAKTNTNLLTLVDNTGNSMIWYGSGYNDVNTYGASLRFYVANNDIVFRTATMDPVMTIKQAGNIGIGTTNPAYPLAVNGTIEAKEVLVQTGWSDYVFAAGYPLRKLGDVATYIDLNHHLPDMPSAKDVARNGIAVGEMESRLLAKIEELTLHAIDADRRIARLENQNRELQVQNRALLKAKSETAHKQ